MRESDIPMVSIPLLTYGFVHRIQLNHCLQEWGTGIHITERFNRLKYEGIWKATMSLIKRTESDEYHGAKLLASREQWASNGR